MDETVKQNLLNRFAAYLDGLDHAGSDQAPELEEETRQTEEADLFSIYVELAGLRNETRSQSRIVKEALDRFRSVFDTLQASHATLEQELKRSRADADERERKLLRPLLLDIIDVRDRLAAGLKPAVAPPPQRRWYERFRGEPRAQLALEAWQEGMRMTLRRVDRLLSDQRIALIETMGRPLDPRHAAAVATVEHPSAADGVVVEEVRPGFVWEGELLRPAEVIVARGGMRKEDDT